MVRYGMELLMWMFNKILIWRIMSIVKLMLTVSAMPVFYCTGTIIIIISYDLGKLFIRYVMVWLSRTHGSHFIELSSWIFKIPLNLALVNTTWWQLWLETVPLTSFCLSSFLQNPHSPKTRDCWQKWRPPYQVASPDPLTSQSQKSGPSGSDGLSVSESPWDHMRRVRRHKSTLSFTRWGMRKMTFCGHSSWVKMTLKSTVQWKRGSKDSLWNVGMSSERAKFNLRNRKRERQ